MTTFYYQHHHKTVSYLIQISMLKQYVALLHYLLTFLA